MAGAAFFFLAAWWAFFLAFVDPFLAIESEDMEESLDIESDDGAGVAAGACARAGTVEAATNESSANAEMSDFITEAPGWEVEAWCD
jgi:hypothetical protein